MYIQHLQSKWIVHDCQYIVKRDQNLYVCEMQLCRAGQLRLLQKSMVTKLVNEYLAFEYITDKKLHLQESSNSFAQALCAKVGGGGGGG
jgi:hypothetical protein